MQQSLVFLHLLGLRFAVAHKRLETYFLKPRFAEAFLCLLGQNEGVRPMFHDYHCISQLASV